MEICFESPCCPRFPIAPYLYLTSFSIYTPGSGLYAGWFPCLEYSSFRHRNYYFLISIKSLLTCHLSNYQNCNPLFLIALPWFCFHSTYRHPTCKRSKCRDTKSECAWWAWRTIGRLVAGIQWMRGRAMQHVSEILSWLVHVRSYRTQQY